MVDGGLGRNRTRATFRDTVSLDLSVWMHHPDDWDFRPTLSYAGNTLTITCANEGTTLASVDSSMTSRTRPLNETEWLNCV